MLRNTPVIYFFFFFGKVVYTCYACHINKENKKLMNKTEQIHIRLTKDQKDFIIKKMEKEKVSNFSQFALKMMIQGKYVLVDFKPLYQYNKEISKIGNNINQLTKVAHLKDGNLDVVEVIYLQDCMDSLLKMNAKLLTIVNRYLKKVNDI